MREGWVSTTLGVVAQRTVGRTPPRKEVKYWTDDTRMPFCTIKSMQNRTKMEFSEGVTKQAVEDSVARLAPQGALLLSFKLSIGRVRFAPRNLYFNEAIAWVRPDESVVEKHFLALALEDVDWDSLGARAVKGKTLNAQSLDAVPLAIPPLDEQRRIVDLMDSVDAAISAAQAEVDAAAQLRERVLGHELGTPGENWEKTTLGELVAFASGYAFPHKFQGRTEGDYPFLKVSDMNSSGNTRLLRTGTNWVTAEMMVALKAKAHPAGTVVFPKVGAALLTEKRRLLAVPAAFDNNIMGLVARERILNTYLLLFMETVKLSRYAQHGAVPSINQSHIRSVQIELPPLADQQRIVETMATLDTAVITAQSALDRLRDLRSSMLTVLLSGEHEIPESYDQFLTDTAAAKTG